MPGFLLGNERRKSRRILPAAGFEELENLPALFVHDGEDALKFGLFANVLDNLIADKRIEPIVAVFVPPVERKAEYARFKQRR